ncbi:Nucleoporin-like protein 2 [Anabarilius grahami]|uniref:Nucleoporin NUP42 n=1 Tax=Anabarilius grahami TaxID=495550 RepID=A0A3N0Y0B6_ANAGA|nr:Nucleoporin-like protein 2 [Anabarilius grahami]
MTVCSFFLQGRCRYGDKCWNEHPRDGRGGGEYRGNQQQPSRGGYGNRVWINPAQRSGSEFIQPSSFSRGGNDGSRGGGNDWSRGGGNDWSRGGGGGGNDWNRGGGGGGNDWSRGGGGGGNDWNRGGGNDRSRGGGNDWSRGSGNDGSRGGGNDWGRGGGMSRDFSSQNRFSALGSQSNFDTAGQNAADDNATHVETIQSDMEVWQTSGQWPFSCYSALNKQISGFVEWSPEELRQEYYTYRASGDIQPYVNSVQLLANQWSNRVQELRTMSRPTQISLISELNNSSPQTPSHGLGSSSIQGFDSTASGFGATSSSTTSGFGAGALEFDPLQFILYVLVGNSYIVFSGFGSGTQSINSFSFAQSKTDFGAAPDFGGAAFSPAQTAAGFSSPTPSATSFSFAASAAENNSSSAAGFSFKTSPPGLGSGFGSSAPPASGGFGQSSAVFTGAAQAAGNSGGSLFTAQSDLSAEELKEFTARCFTLGQIPLKPPPADLLMV